MKYEDLVNCVGESDVVHKLQPQTHTVKVIGRDDWACYMAQPLRELWHMLKENKHPNLLENLTYSDLEDFCWQFSKKRDAAAYSKWYRELDGMY